MAEIQQMCNKRVILAVSAIFLVSVVLYYSVGNFPLIHKGAEIPQIFNGSVFFENLDIKTRFSERQRHLRDVCLKKGYETPFSLSESIFPGQTFVETKHKIFYCPVQKVGSSIWTKTLQVMSSHGRVNSPYEMKHRKSQGLQNYQNFRNTSTEYKYFKDRYMKKAISLIVVRDPYTKLFSAYVDKLYKPNYLFWKIAGQKMEELKSHGTAKCGNEISFSDFIKFIINQTNSKKRLNNHFSPIYMHCHPCKTKYDYIMKFENFTNEYHYLINKWNDRFNLQVSFKDFEREKALYIASKHINLCFSTIRLYSEKCNIPVYNFLLRTWRFLQISGILPKQVDLPFPNNENVNKVTKERLLDAVREVLEEEFDWEQVKKQRHEALVQGYRSIDNRDIKKLREIVKPDCQYFGYDDSPSYLSENQSEPFNYFDGITMFY